MEPLSILSYSHGPTQLMRQKKSMKGAGRKALTDAFRARIYMKRSGKDFYPFRREVVNGHVARCREHPTDTVEANRQMEFNKPVLYKKK